jgi:3-keto-disaccharide hydrolase
MPASLLRLFNGTNLSGFHTWLVDTKQADPRHVFTVTNGMIRISGDGLGYLSTEKAYQDYHLIAEFRWGQNNSRWGDRLGKARDSGIFLHSAGPEGNSYDGQGAFKAAIECNIFQGATGDLLLIRGTNADGSPIEPRITAEVSGERDTEGWFTWQKGGAPRSLVRWGRLNWFGKDRNWQDQLDFRGRHDLESPFGEWTRLECICDGQRITVRVNGTAVNEGFAVSPSSGKILLQCEGSEIFFRRLELYPLAKPRDPSSSSR